MIRLRGARLAAATLLVLLAALCLFFALVTLLFNFETVALAPWPYVIALAAAVLGVDTGLLFLLFRGRGPA